MRKKLIQFVFTQKEPGKVPIHNATTMKPYSMYFISFEVCLKTQYIKVKHYDTWLFNNGDSSNKYIAKYSEVFRILVTIELNIKYIT